MKYYLNFLSFALVCSLVLLNLGCKKDPPKVIPTLTTSVTNVTAVSATVTGSIEYDGGSAVTMRGVCWNTNPEPTTINLKVSVGLGEGLFSTTITGLLPGSTYYIRSYAVNSIGTGYGNQVSISTPAILPAITTTPLSAITATTANGGGYITNDGGAPITSRGVCWDINQNPTILSAASSASNPEILVLNAKTTDGSGTGSYVSSMTGLNPGTTYYVRAYAINSVGTSYGNQIIGTTLAVLPTVSTTAVTNITESSLTCGGAITYDGGSAVTVRGVCWSTTQNPTTSNSKTNDGTGSSSWVSSVTGLSPGTTYYLRGYATNSMGTAYGDQKSAITLAAPPTVNTLAVNPTTETTATGGGNIVSDGGSPVTARGICWSTNQSPTILNNRTLNGTGTGSFTSSMTGLTTNTTYYVRAYATNAIGTSYGSESSIVLYLNVPGPNVTDADGNLYNSVRIGSQIWMAKNLRSRKYLNGDILPNITDNTQWSLATQGAYCNFLNSESTGVIYGYLYNYYAVTDNRNICPAGWHVPTREEWLVLINYLGGDNVASSKIRVSGLTYWNHNKGTNSSGFGALGTSWRGDDGLFYYSLGSGAYWWTNSVFSNTYPFYTYLYSDPNNLRVGYGHYFEKNAGVSVRCVKDL
jgi:uncharacterized protein (TIGR02145 family)